MNRKYIASLFGIGLISTLNINAVQASSEKAAWATSSKTENRFIVELNDTPLITLKRLAKETKKGTSTVSQMKSASKTQAAKRQAFIKAVNQISDRTKVAKEYGELFNGLAITTDLTEQQVEALTHVANAYPIQTYKPNLETSLSLTASTEGWELVGGKENAGKGVKVAVIDTGIVPEHPMFDDAGMTAPNQDELPQDDYCSISPDFCNNKLIVARHYLPNGININEIDEFASPRGLAGHGTHVAGAAVGRQVTTPDGETIAGVAPGAYLMAYKVYWGRQSAGTDFELLSALEDAWKDGADVINNSWGSEFGGTEITSLYTAIFNEMERNNVVLVTAAGNDGIRGEGSISCPGCVEAGITVGASTTSYVAGFNLHFGEDKTQSVLSFPGSTFLIGSPTFSAPGALAPEGNELGCQFLSKEDYQDKVLVVEMDVDPREDCSFLQKITNAQRAGAAGLVAYLNGDGAKYIANDFGTIIVGTMINHRDGEALKTYLTDNPDAILTLDNFITTIHDENEQDQMAGFSSYGPNGDPTFIKPDMVAPGVSILSAMATTDNPVNPVEYQRMNGTSMATPMVAGAAAMVLAQSPDLTAQQVKSILVNSVNNTVTLRGGSERAGAFHTGSGRLNVEQAINAKAYAQKPNILMKDCITRCHVNNQLNSLTSEAVTWTAEVSFFNSALIGNVTPSEITLSSTNPSQEYELAVSVPFGTLQDWYFGELIWRSNTGETMVQALAISNTSPKSEFVDVTVNGLEQGQQKTINVKAINFTKANALPFEFELIGNTQFVPDYFNVISGNVNKDDVTFGADNISLEAAVAPAQFDVDSESLPFELNLADERLSTIVPCSAGCDEFNEAINFNYKHFGEEHRWISMFENGFALTGGALEPKGDFHRNPHFPSDIQPNGVIAPFWSDFDLKDDSLRSDSGGGRLMWMKHEHEGELYLILQWQKVKLWMSSIYGRTESYWGVNDRNSEYTFQLILKENSDQKWFRYLEIPEQPQYYSVGMENDSGTVGYTHWFDGNGVAKVESGQSFSVGYTPAQSVEFEVKIAFNAQGEFTEEDSITTAVNTPAVVNLTVNDLDSAEASVLTTNIAGKEETHFLFRTGQTDAGETISVDLSSLQVSSVPSHGSVEVLQDGFVKYTPEADYQGSDSFEYQLTNNIGETSTATVSVMVGQPIVVHVDAPAVIEDNSSVTLTASVQNSSDTHTYQWILPEQLTTDDNQSASINVSLGHINYDQLATIKLIVSNGSSSVEETVEVNLTNVNHPPTVPVITGPDTIVGERIGTFRVTASDPFDSGNDLTYTWVIPDRLKRISSTSNSISVRADDWSAGTATIEVTVTDGEFSESASITVGLEKPESEKTGGSNGYLLLTVIALLTVLRRTVKLK